MSLADNIRDYALGPLGPSTSVFSLPHSLVESFLTFDDWETHSLWSVNWRTFALIVAESLDSSSQAAAQAGNDAPFAFRNWMAQWPEHSERDLLKMGSAFSAGVDYARGVNVVDGGEQC